MESWPGVWLSFEVWSCSGQVWFFLHSVKVGINGYHRYPLGYLQKRSARPHAESSFEVWRITSCNRFCSHTRVLHSYHEVILLLSPFMFRQNKECLHHPLGCHWEGHFMESWSSSYPDLPNDFIFSETIRIRIIFIIYIHSLKQIRGSFPFRLCKIDTSQWFNQEAIGKSRCPAFKGHLGQSGLVLLNTTTELKSALGSV